MNNFKQDTLFCGVRQEKILSAQPILNEIIIKEWFFHQRERTNIYYKKEILGESAPWTDDEILQKYKFVNTKRTFDRESRYLLKNIVHNSSLTYQEKILNCILFRVINKGETFDIFGGSLSFFQDNIHFDNLKKKLNNKSTSEPDYVFFSAAYILGSPKVHFGKYLEEKEGKVEKNMVMRMIKFIHYEKENIIEGITSSKNQKEICDFLSTYPGIGKFLSYQMFVDFTYIEDFPFTEHNFVVSGPGCARGLNWIFKNKDGMTDEECLFWFTLNQHKIAKKYNEEWNPQEIFHFLPKDQQLYTLMDMENSGACEIDKRCRTLFSGKRPKQRYKGE
ncbi:MAG: hypothetical protein GY828_06725 [Candidatus Gracilibacteria bacterium]|nr:hypothetical protein [Candidatus Gracilibacteria bacterium]